MDNYSVFKKLAFQFDPEKVHDLTLKLSSKFPALAHTFSPITFEEELELKINGLNWSFPIGLAAGFDKNAYALEFFEKLGFGAIEVGTITKRPQAGNPRPRIQRHEKIESIQNAMGFPNLGSKAIHKNIKSSNLKRALIGANIGKNKDTSEADTPREYAELYKSFAPISDYVTINISSPNTPGLRDFQKKEKLMPILEAVSAEKKNQEIPVFIKIAPDLQRSEIKLICELSKELNLSGIIASNTTIQHDFGKGGLSGKYIRPYALKAREMICEVLAEDPSQTIIGAGGIDSYQDVKDFWKMGGHYAQVYTGFIYKGPKLLHEIKNGIKEDMDTYGFKNLNEMIKNSSLIK